jgi:hypothetical protein
MVGEDTVDTVAGPAAGSPQQKGETLATNSAETLGKFRARSTIEVRETRGLLPEAKEDLSWLKRQLKLQPVLKEGQISNPQELQKVPGSLATSRKDSDVRPSPPSTLTKVMTMTSDIDRQPLQVLRKAPLSASRARLVGSTH